MAATSLLEANPLKWKQNYTARLSPHRMPRTNLGFVKPLQFNAVIHVKCPARCTMKCFYLQNHLVESTSHEESRKNPLEILANTVLSALKSLRKPAIAAALLGLLLMYNPNSALAASGGRMGGTSFRSSSSESRSSSYLPSSNSYSTSFIYSAPYSAPPSLGYFGPAVGVGVGTGNSLFLILMGFMAFVVVSGFLSNQSDGSVLTATDKTTVLKLQVGLLGMARTLQMDLNRIAEFADTSSSTGLSYVLTETTLALLRHPDYCISGYSSVDIKKSMEDGEKRFNQLSIEERGKFDEETLVNVNNIKRKNTGSQRANGFSNEYIVITILVAAQGVHKLPTINGSGDLKEALQKLGSIPSSRILAVEVLWTPQNENDSLSERELLEDYPLLRPL
ncbi:hypothetical protein L6164_035128 [Bauhinia variegata]|uniref:Uncharacterized protein n=1 Tax=Bauhinia variegata TaxID=167791 RepID=A0ACB9KXI5_BAUVA|nr:hypothetical protein L6164_035128 [Bauhinia variegata]